MGLIRRAAHCMFGDRVPSNEEHTLLQQAKELRRRAKWANRLSKNTAATRMVNQQALQMTLAYETIREQRYRRLAAMYTAKRNDRKTVKFLHRAECSHLVIEQLRRELVAYEPLQQPSIPVAPPAYSTYTVIQQQQPGAVAAVPINTQPPPTAHYPMSAPPPYTAHYAHYPTVSQLDSATSSPSSHSFSSSSSDSSASSPMSDRSQLQEPWLKAAEKRTVY